MDQDELGRDVDEGGAPAEPYAGVFRPPRADDLEAERTAARAADAAAEAAKAGSDETGLRSNESSRRDDGPPDGAPGVHAGSAPPSEHTGPGQL